MKEFSNIKFKNIVIGIMGFLFVFYITNGYSQNAGISANGSIPPNSAAGLDVNFTTQGLLVPRISLASTTSFSPLTAHVAGMVVYNTATIGDVVPGFYYNDGTKWVAGFPKGNSAGDMQYWNGTKWTSIPVGQPGQMLQVNPSGVPTWVGAGYASLSTSSVSAVTSSSAVCGGNITTDGGFSVTVHGVCWAITSNPTIANSKTIDGSGIGSFVSNITGLFSATTYYVRSYATNATGTSYGNQISFTTP